MAAPSPSARPLAIGSLVPVLDPAKCIFRQEFDGSAGTGVDESVWTIETGAGGWGNGEQQNYTRSRQNLSLDGSGNLRITLRAENTTDASGNAARFTSSRISTPKGYSASRIEARLSAPSGQGVWPAFWTVGGNIDKVGWPHCGEIDIAEMLNDARSTTNVVHAATLGADGSVTGQWKDFRPITQPASTPADAFHVYAIDLTPGQVTFSVDGVVTFITTRDGRSAGQDWPFDQSQRLVLNLAASRNLPLDNPPRLPVSLLVDYVRVWGA